MGEVSGSNLPRDLILLFCDPARVGTVGQFGRWVPRVSSAGRSPCQPKCGIPTCQPGWNDSRVTVRPVGAMRQVVGGSHLLGWVGWFNMSGCGGSRVSGWLED